jgi:hypothetical protein
MTPREPTADECSQNLAEQPGHGGDAREKGRGRVIYGEAIFDAKGRHIGWGPNIIHLVNHWGKGASHMSQSLYWVPAVARKGRVLPTDLKLALQRRDDGGPDMIVDASNRMYFEGLRDAGIQGAEEVLEALDKYGEIKLYLG